MSIQNAIQNLIAVEKDRSTVDQFAREAFRKKFYRGRNQIGTWHTYEGFEIMNPSKIKILYRGGYGDMEFQDNFTIKIPQI